MSNSRSDRQGRLAATLAAWEGPLLRYALRITGDIENARDVVQDTFSRLCARDVESERPTADQESSQGSADAGERQRPAGVEEHVAEWLFTVCRNRAIDVRRKESRMRAMTAGELDGRSANRAGSGSGLGTTAALRGMDMTDGRATPAQAAEFGEAAACAMALLAGLPENQQEVVRLKFQNGMSYKQIAGITKLSVTNVGFLIHTALKTIREKMRAGERNSDRIAGATAGVSAASNSKSADGGGAAGRRLS